MEYRLIIFDFDGTLADTFPWFMRVFDEIANKYQFKPLDRNSIDVLRGLDARQILVHHQVPFWKLPSIMRYTRALMERDIENISLFSGITDALRGLSERGATLAIVTSNSRTNVLRVLGPENLVRFRYVECGASLFGKRVKLRRILSATRIAPDAAILVGDEIRDAQAAAEAGIHFGAVAWGYSHIDSLITHDPQKVFAHAGELLPKLLS